MGSTEPERMALREVEHSLPCSFDTADQKPARLTLSVEEAARVIGIGRGLAYELARTGRLPVVRFGRRMVVPRAQLEAMLQAASEQGIADGGAR